MFDKTVDIFKKKDYVIPGVLFEKYAKFGISNEEFIFLIYIINHPDLQFDPKNIAVILEVEVEHIYEALNSLIDKGLITIENRKIEGKLEEYVSFDELYNKMAFSLVNDDDGREDGSIYSLFETEFARGLSPMEYEIISSWRDNGYSEDIIKEALKEAVFNGVNNMRYIDRILFDWNKKGIKKVNDVKVDREKFSKKKNEKKDLFSYDWLSEE